METAIGVFAEPERAEEAVKTLLQHHVPAERIIFLTRSESVAMDIGKQFAARATGLPGAGAASKSGSGATLAIPGVGPVYVHGNGAGTLFGLAGDGTCAAIGTGVAPAPDEPAPPATTSSSDLTFFRRVLSEGYSVIVVRTESSQTAAAACEILDKLGLSIKKAPAPRSTVALRQVHGAVVADFVGKIALAEGTSLLRETIRNFLAHGQDRILLNLERVDFIDSAGLGELVRAEATVRGRHGRLMLVNPGPNVRHLLRITKLDHVIDVEPDEFTALNTLRRSATPNSSG